MSNTQSTQRRHERAELDIFANKIIGDEPHLTRVRDISAGGVFLYKLLEPEVDQGQPIGLEIMLPNAADVIWAVGEIARTESCADTTGVAVRFTRISETDREMIESFVRATAEDQTVAALDRCAA
jgi:c-di-GMP-binding flagellar brake protein YcgR